MVSTRELLTQVVSEISSEFAYLEDCQISKAADHATDPELATKLWDMTEKLIDDLPHIKALSS